MIHHARRKMMVTVIPSLVEPHMEHKPRVVARKGYKDAYELD
jgi:hypothetical protein